MSDYRNESRYESRGESRHDSRGESRYNPRNESRYDSSSDSGSDDKGGGYRRRPSSRRRFPKKKVCRFCEEKVLYIDFKNYRQLREYLTERGKIMPRRITGTCAKHQRLLTTAIKRARNIALLSFIHR